MILRIDYSNPAHLTLLQIWHDHISAEPHGQVNTTRRLRRFLDYNFPQLAKYTPAVDLVEELLLEGVKINE